MWNLTVFLSIIWALNLLYGEWFAYLVPSLRTCSWPHLQRPSSSLRNGADYSSSYVKIAVITDPQLMDRTSFHLARKSLALEIAQFYTDLYMRRAFLSSILPFDPDVVLFLGDYFDGGDILSDDEWQESLGRFRHIFNLDMLQKSSKVEVYYLPGNHDVGYSASNTRKAEIIKRYESEFGARNFKVKLGKVDFIAVDAQMLDGYPRGNLTSVTWKFVKNVSEDISTTRRVLLTHIPLYRPDWTPCGPHRSSPVINQKIFRGRDRDLVYQNYVTENSSNILLDLIRPALVLSGHDHDQCTVTHMSKDGPVTEELYVSLFAMTLVIVLVWPVNEVLVYRKLGGLMVSLRNMYNSFSTGVKEKNEDENCEYEEIWDAEGSMHLIKKTRKVSSTSVNNSSSPERGNAVMRSKVRKQVGPELHGPTPDVSIHIGPITRTHRSKAKMIIWRLLRALRALITIAAFNVPLYVLLVFKDWIDK
ncbi:hypothetical protein OROGR_030545 [Orobanche gracilis]